jgi:hypothetical protein
LLGQNVPEPQKHMHGGTQPGGARPGGARSSGLGSASTVLLIGKGSELELYYFPHPEPEPHQKLLIHSNVVTGEQNKIGDRHRQKFCYHFGLLVGSAASTS